MTIIRPRNVQRCTKIRKKNPVCSEYILSFAQKRPSCPKGISRNRGLCHISALSFATPFSFSFPLNLFLNGVNGFLPRKIFSLSLSLSSSLFQNAKMCLLRGQTSNVFGDKKSRKRRTNLKDCISHLPIATVMS